jgi:hypothetical protein
MPGTAYVLDRGYAGSWIRTSGNSPFIGNSVNEGMKVRARASKNSALSAQGTQRRQRRVSLPLVASRRAMPSSALCGTCLRGSGLCGNNGTHAYRSTLRADDPGNIQGTPGAVLVPPVSGGA